MQDDEITIVLTPPTGTFIYNYLHSAYLLICCTASVQLTAY